MLNPLKNIRLLFSIFLFVAVTSLKAQESSDPTMTFEAGARPDIPGMLGIEFGWVLVPDFPEEMKLNFLGSILISPYYKYDFNITKSNFSIHPGIAFTSEKYSFKNNITLVSNPTSDGYVTELVGLDSIIPDATIKRSILSAVYFEIPLEISFRTNRELPKKSFKFTVGAKGGVLIDSKTKFVYRQDGQNKRTKQKERYDLNTWRVLLVGKIGYASVNLFYTYNILPIFRNDKGPLGTQAKQMSLGISFDLF